MAARAKSSAILREEISRRVHHVVLLIPLGGLAIGAMTMAVEPHFALFGAALILGWTQLAGL